MGHSGDDFTLALESSQQVDLRFTKHSLHLEVAAHFDDDDEPSTEFADKYRYEGETGEKLGE